MTGKDETISYIEQNKERFLNELFELLKIKSISADTQYKAEVLRAAVFLKDHLESLGAEQAEAIPTEGYPIVYAEKIIDINLPTVLIYGHYDVQPADPLELWKSPPFEPVIKDNKIYARGSSDDKGQMFIHIKAFESMMKTNSLPCNIKFMLEGEEEVGSGNLAGFVKNNKEKLKADLILISDTSIIANNTPSITVGLRGLSYMEVEVTGPNRDLHSGVYGGAVANPINILCKMIASLTDDDNRVTIPGFYNKVREYSDTEREELAKRPFNLEGYKKDLGIDDIMGEKGYSTIERTGIRPTLDVNGIWGGYTGEGSKTVLPSKANAKISMRLVSDQDYKEISDLFTRHIVNIAPKGVKVKITPHHGGQPAITPIDSIAYEAASLAFEEAWGKKPVPAMEGGSIPIVALFQQELGLNSVLMGFGLDSDSIHSPNESFGLMNFYKGIETVVYMHRHFANLKKRQE
jgi:acetylornithine deacetylase/succinyl-diaminopimelate desuccinylase-like protein